ncbi:hypothetical protein Pla8534_55200 [Lignipirellula cremea]|uniref:PqqC-like protein n=2 Tax=Lignipirellula cremea TaxID=2528010 RepID=A0A518E0Q8_9BACT|nr:hypothetical protein Pla8534_55200 [Lignipirellula cremea]
METLTTKTACGKNDQESLTPEEMEQRLYAAVDSHKFEESRFYKLVVKPKCPPALIARWAWAVHASATTFCAMLADLVETAPTTAARLTLLENLMEEEGIFLHASHGLVAKPEAKHCALSLRLAQACSQELEAPQGASDTIVKANRYIQEGRWLETVSFILVGQELRFARTSLLMYEVLKKKGFSEWDLAFLTVHGEADERHGREAIELVVDHALTREEQELALQAAEAGARHFFNTYN